MKEKYFYLLIVCLSLLSCESNGVIVITDPESFSEFYVNNQSDSKLQLEFTVSKNYSNQLGNTLIQSKELKLIFEIGDMGQSPTPEEVFDEIKIYKIDATNEKLVLTISPVSDSEWTLVKSSNTSKKLAVYELNIKNEQLN